MGSSRSKGSRIHGVHNQLSKVSETSPRPGWDVPRCRGAVSGLPGPYSMGEIFASAPPALIVIHPGSAASSVGSGGCGSRLRGLVSRD